MGARTIKFNKRATDKLIALLEYLESEWGKKTATAFYLRLFEKLDAIAFMPGLVRLEFPEKKIRSISIVKQIRLFYIANSNTIFVLNLFDTRQHPRKKLT